MATLLILRWIGVALWIAVLARLARPALRALGRQPLPFDPMWLLIWMMALNRLFYQGTGVVVVRVPESGEEMAWRIFMQGWSIAIALGILWVKRWFKARRNA